MKEVADLKVGEKNIINVPLVGRNRIPTTPYQVRSDGVFCERLG